MAKEVIIMGASGHGKVIADIIEKSQDKVIGFLDDNTDIKKVLGYPVLGKVTDCVKYQDKLFIIAIGNNNIRQNIAKTYVELKYYTAIHPTAVLSKNVTVGKGTAIMANAVLNSCAVVGEHCIINTASVVEHDDNLNDFVHVSPKACLGGTVTIGEATHIGIGASIKNNINICEKCIVGAGAVVIRDIEESGTYVGVPVKMI